SVVQLGNTGHEDCWTSSPRIPQPSWMDFKPQNSPLPESFPIPQIVVWKRYSDFKKLHADLAYTHRNLFRRMEDFPTFPRAQVFGRFDPEVIEERRKAAEDMLHFTVHIPALNNSPQLKEFFRVSSFICSAFYFGTRATLGGGKREGADCALRIGGLPG
uniref:PX domain-containing protein n=1 Tax=Laticauda laticaudata TaxID=8630 RepID=A0A8C5S4S2_LATLA